MENSQTESRNIEPDGIPPRKNNFRKKILVITGVVLFSVIASYFWIEGAQDFLFNLIKEPLFPKERKVSVSPGDQAALGKRLMHETSLAELGINFPKENGNSADIYIALAGTFEQPGSWNKKYGGKKEEDIFLDRDDIEMLLQMASREFFSFFPEHFPLPDSPLDLPQLRLPPLNTMRIIAKHAAATAARLEGEGRTAEAEELLQSLIVIGRQFEDSEFNTPMQWFVGNEIEKIASESLLDFYQRNGDGAKSVALSSYVREVDEVKKKLGSFSEKSAKNIIVSIALYALARDHPSPDRAFVRTLYQKLETDETEFQAWLDSLKAADDQIIQMDVIFPMILLKNANGLEPERSAAEAVLKQYAESGNRYVAEYSQKALRLSTDQITQWFELNK